jgi:hypothetical protein
MTNSTLDKLRAELDDWQARLQHLRVKANLGGKELRDKLNELGNRLEPAQQKAEEQLGKIATDGKEEAKTLARSLKAGWEELRRKHRELSEEADKERAKLG